jgi:hypothetical protein
MKNLKQIQLERLIHSNSNRKTSKIKNKNRNSKHSNNILNEEPMYLVTLVDLRTQNLLLITILNDKFLNQNQEQ